MKKRLLLSFPLIFVGLLCYAQPTSQTFNSSGTWTVPAGYSATITVDVWGGGGGGGTGTGRAGGGGGGAYASSTFVVGPGNYTITVGTGGSQGLQGGTSSFSSTVIAVGGSSGSGDGPFAGGAAASSTGTIRFSGGAGGTAASNVGGGGGGSAFIGSNGNPGVGQAAGTGTGTGGTGGANGGSGTLGSTPGGGGGGKGNGSGPVSGAGGSGRVIISVIGSLPVELTSFVIKPVKQSIELNWNTASEINNEKFLIERSTDGKTFKVIGEKAGNGNTNEPQSYQFMDQRPEAGINYYRLKQIDFNGGFEYSQVASALMRNVGEILVYPTVTKGELKIVLPEDALTSTLVNIYNLQGVLVSKQVQEGSGTLNVTLPQLVEGQYIVEVINGNISKRTQIFKQ
ncbi:MAG: T9SS type A sorting domain-containing protein [Bacteroidetes bacterium]|nr:T9SS type A sorting domain-containing protein [Bacteroidota bacterium]